MAFQPIEDDWRKIAVADDDRAPGLVGAHDELGAAETGGVANLPATAIERGDHTDTQPIVPTCPGARWAENDDHLHTAEAARRLKMIARDLHRLGVRGAFKTLGGDARAHAVEGIE